MLSREGCAKWAEGPRFSAYLIYIAQVTPHRLKDVRRIQAKALRNGGKQLSLSTVEWDIAGRCERPVPVVLEGQHEHKWREKSRQKIRKAGFSRLMMSTRCRKCGPCLRYRSMSWKAKAGREIRSAQRTWWCTYTLSPQVHHEAWLRICVRLRKAGINPLELSAERAFKERAAELGKLFTDYVKRVRKQSQSQIRYLLVVESHKSGLPHLHALMHECQGTLLHRHVNGQWYAGFSSAVLVGSKDDVSPEKVIHYVTKYISKQAVARIRASLHYGDNDEPVLNRSSEALATEGSGVKPASLEAKSKKPLF